MIANVHTARRHEYVLSGWQLIGTACALSWVLVAGCAETKPRGPGIAPAQKGPVSATIENPQLSEDAFAYSLKLTSERLVHLDAGAVSFLNANGCFFIGAAGCFRLEAHRTEGTAKPDLSEASRILVPGESLLVPIAIPLTPRPAFVNVANGQERDSLPAGAYVLVRDLDLFQCVFASDPTQRKAVDAKCRAEGFLRIP
jgi:hypothetical protein